jgi:hypothetical protein
VKEGPRGHLTLLNSRLNFKDFSNLKNVTVIFQGLFCKFMGWGALDPRLSGLETIGHRI